MTTDTDATTSQLAVCFVDIVGYTSPQQAARRAEFELVSEHPSPRRPAWSSTTAGGSSRPPATRSLRRRPGRRRGRDRAPLTERVADHDDPFPEVRAGLAHGAVVSRLGDVFGPTVNIAARLTSAAWPGTVLVDPARTTSRGGPAYLLRSVRRTAVVGLRPAPAVALRRADPGGGR